MNFRLFILFLLSFLLCSCGVKAPPRPYEEVAIPAYVNSYTGEDTLTPAPVPIQKEKKR